MTIDWNAPLEASDEMVEAAWKAFDNSTKPAPFNQMRDAVNAALALRNRQPANAPSPELVERLTQAKVLIGARNDNASEAVRQSNVNQAWHILDAILAELEPTDPDLILAREVLRDHGYERDGTAEEALVRDAIKRVRSEK